MSFLFFITFPNLGLTLSILGLLWLYMNPIGDTSPYKVSDSTNDNQFKTVS